MATKRLTIELSSDQYELLRREANATGTTITGIIRRLVEEIRLRVPEEARKKYQEDPLYSRRGSFDGAKDLSENHDDYLYGPSIP
jgi:hypothetical protein